MDIEFDKSTVKEKRNSVVIVNTGDGKGKTTASLGTAFRALGWGWKVLMIQFIKGKWNPGEKRCAEKLNLPFEIISLGSGFTWDTKNKEHDITECSKAWDYAKEKILSTEYDLIILDELNIVLSLKYLPVTKVIDVLKERKKWVNIIITGRKAPDELIEYADLVTEMKKIKHPFDKGKKALKGIEF
ncbi:MAG: cob(I)yrinic acid a,c-diamide adenosyltransferase [bacterium]|nr:cob(I)yrinic acid a,c-diamide adenosyltransferase [bacterium]